MPARKDLQYFIDQQGCHVCTSHWKTDKGYPRFTRKGKYVFVSRFLWEQKHGAIPSGLCVLHKCDNPACINPEHFFLGTNLDNIRDKVAKDRHKKGEAVSNHKLTELQAREILSASGSHNEIAQRYGVDGSLVGKIKKGVNWKHLSR